MPQHSFNRPKGAGKSSFELINPALLKESLPLKQGSVILDLACGKGAYTLFLSGIAGDTGLVYALDLWEQGLEIIAEKIEQDHITNILPLHQDAAKEIEIDEYSVDLILMATVLHDFKEMGTWKPVLEQVKTLLNPRGHLAVIEFKKIQGPPGPPIDIRLSPEETQTMVAPYGFRQIKHMDIGEYNYLTLFQETDGD